MRKIGAIQKIWLTRFMHQSVSIVDIFVLQKSLLWMTKTYLHFLVCSYPASLSLLSRLSDTWVSCTGKLLALYIKLPFLLLVKAFYFLYTSVWKKRTVVILTDDIVKLSLCLDQVKMLTTKCHNALHIFYYPFQRFPGLTT